MHMPNNGPGKSVVPESADAVSQQVLELALLTLSGMSVTEAAKQLGISRSTAHRRMKTPEYRAVIAEARQLASRELLNSLLALDSVALKTMIDGLTHPISTTRVSTLRLFLEARKQLLEEVELEDRISRLEELTKDRGVVEGEARKLP
jgi:DNA-binding Lrp family transcriptional regulator